MTDTTKHELNKKTRRSEPKKYISKSSNGTVAQEKNSRKGTGVRQRTTPGRPGDDDFTQDWVCHKQPEKIVMNQSLRDL